MAILRQARLVDGRKEGRWIYYRRTDATSGPYAADTWTWLDKCLQGNSAIKADHKQLKSLLKFDPEEICKRQAKCG